MEGSTNNLFVIDASFVLTFLLKENNNESNEIMRQYKEREIRLISSYLLTFEVCNTLKTAVLKKRMNKSQAQELLEAFLELDIAEEKIDYIKTMQLALSKNLTFYDASYVFLAKKYKIPLLTLDTKLK